MPEPVTILAVEDEEPIRELIVAALEDGGYSVLVASSAREAYNVLEELSVELGGLVTDINLGQSGRNGWDVARRARELCASIPVVYVSGDSAHEWSANGVPKSVLIRKPFASADLTVALAELRTTS